MAYQLAAVQTGAGMDVTGSQQAGLWGPTQATVHPQAALAAFNALPMAFAKTWGSMSTLTPDNCLPQAQPYNASFTMASQLQGIGAAGMLPFASAPSPAPSLGGFPMAMPTHSGAMNAAAAAAAAYAAAAFAAQQQQQPCVSNGSTGPHERALAQSFLMHSMAQQMACPAASGPPSPSVQQAGTSKHHRSKLESRTVQHEHTSKAASAVASALLERSRVSSEEPSAGSMSTASAGQRRVRSSEVPCQPQEAAVEQQQKQAQQVQVQAPNKGKQPAGAQLRKLLGDAGMAQVRQTMLRQQKVFVQQLFELHKVSQVQKLVCYEVMGYEPSVAHGTRVAPIGLPGSSGDVPQVSQDVWGRAWDDGSKLSQPSVSAPVPYGGHQQWPIASAGGAERAADPGSLARPQPPKDPQAIHQLPTIPSALRKRTASQAGGPQASWPAASVRSADVRSGLLRPAPSKPTMTGAATDDEPQQSLSVQQPRTFGGHRSISHQGASSFKKVHGVAENGHAHTTDGTSRLPASQAVDSAGPRNQVPKSSGSTLLEAAAAVLRAAGDGALVAPVAGLPVEVQRSELVARHAPSTPNGSFMSVLPPLAPPLMLAPPAQLLGAPQVAAAPALSGMMVRPQLDPHAAWFAKHFDAAARAASGAPAPSGGSSAAAPGSAPVASAALEGAAVPTGSMPAPSLPVRWWQNEAGTFGDITPSMLDEQARKRAPTEEAHPQALLPHKKRAKLAGSTSMDEGGGNATGTAGKGNSMLPPSAFKPVMPRKARSKRGSNRLSARDDDQHSEDSGSSFNVDGRPTMSAGMSTGMAVGSRIMGGAARRYAMSMSGTQQFSAAGGDMPTTSGSPPVVHPLPVMSHDMPPPQHRQVAAGVVADGAKVGVAAGHSEKSAAGILLSLSSGGGATL